MRVLMIIRSQAGVPGGSGAPGGQIGMVQLARALDRLGVDIEIFVGGPRMRYLSGLDGIKISYFDWPEWRDELAKASPGFVRNRISSLRQSRWLDAVASLPSFSSADVIHVQGLEYTELLLTRFRVPLVVTHWGRVGRWLPSAPGSRDALSLQRRVQRIKENAKLVAIGEAQADALAEANMPVASIIPPGIDLGRFKPGDRSEARIRLGWPTDSGTVLYVGRLTNDKNVGSLLKAYARLSSQARPKRLVIIGDGPNRDLIRKMCTELGISSSTTFLPFVPHYDLPLYYQAADLTVVPSDRLETFCMVALEALACHCPLVVTSQVPEIPRRFPWVPVVEPYDVELFAQKIDAILNGRVNFAPPEMTAFGWDSMASNYVALYRTVLRQAGRAGQETI